MLPEPPFGLGQRAGVEHDEERPDGPLGPLHGARVDIGRAAAQAREAATRPAGIQGRDHVRQGLPHHGRDLRRRGLELPEAVEERQALVGPAESGEEALERGPASAPERGLRGLLQPFTEHDGPLLEVGEEALTLFADLEIGEAPEDDEGDEPDRADETRRHAHAAPRGPAAAASRSSSRCTSSTPSNRYVARDAVPAGPTRTVIA